MGALFRDFGLDVIDSGDREAGFGVAGKMRVADDIA
jgi:hypothetical protein